jgi:hypothetical protein
MNLLGTVMKRNTDTLSDASKNVVIKVNWRKLDIFCSIITRMWGQSMKFRRRSLWKWVTIKIFWNDSNGSTLHSWKIRSRLNFDSVCNLSVQNLLSCGFCMGVKFHL